MIEPPQLQFFVVAPLVFVAVGSMLVLLGEVVFTQRRSLLGRELTDAWIGSALAFASMFWLGLAVYAALGSFVQGSVGTFNPSHPLYQMDPFSSLVIAFIALAALLSCALSISYLAELGINHGEFYALILFSTAGMMLMVAAVDLIAVFVGLELMSIPLYVLAGFDRQKLRSNESALKYFLIGSFASAILLYGMALLYGATGSTSFPEIRAALDPTDPLALIGLGLVVVGFAFKISSVPFHQWTPDVYEGAPSVVTAFMSVTVKLAAFAALLRLIGLCFGAQGAILNDVLWVLAALTMVVGNVMAVIQENVKRLLGYSSVAHAGYLLAGIATGTPEGYAAVVFYLIVYVFMNLGAFGVVVALAHHGQDCERIESFAGLHRSRPGLAALMTLFMVSLAGIPGTAGFMAKLFVFGAAVRSELVGLTILGVLMSAVSFYYYLRVPVLMYMRDPSEEAPRLEFATGEMLVLGVCAVVVLVYGIFPSGWWYAPPLFEWARASVAPLFAS